MKRENGNSLTEIVCVLAIGGMIASVSVPHVAGMVGKAKVRGAIREIAAVFREARWHAVSKGKSIGVQFKKEQDLYLYRIYEDGNNNGIRTADINSGKDILINGPYQIKSRYGNVDFSILKGKPIRKIPPETGFIENPDDPIKLGKSDIASFSPTGDSSSGTVYISDEKDRMMAVVLFGPTVRIRVWEYVYEENRWRM
ncbi:MAG: hypothetical protein AB1756_03130 [Acidobacteriota bacterium]